MQALTFLIELAEPLLATQPHSGEANSAVTYSFIPGSMIRGALIRAYLGNNPGLDLTADDAGRRRFLGGGVRFLNAYPAHPASKRRMLPKPLSWFVNKDDVDDDQATIADFAVNEDHNLDKPKSPKGEYCHISGEVAYMGTVTRQVNVHNASDDRNRKQVGISQVYRYEAIAAGAVFAGVILVETESDVDDLKQSLESDLFVLGGSHTGGYGRVEISDVKKVDKEWHEYVAESPVNGALTITLLSDAILRTLDGQLSAALADTLGIDDGADSAFQRVRAVGGFNRKWGLPLPQSWALEAGSVFKFPAGAIDDETLRNLVEQGIGERRVEGFGRIAVNWHTKPTHERAELPSRRRKSPPKLSAESQTLAKRMADRQLRARLERGLIAALPVDLRSFKSLPSTSQLSRVRTAARHAMLTQDLSVVTNHMDSLKGAKTDWQKARYRGKVLFKWVQEHGTLSSEKLAVILGLAGDMPRMAGVESSLSDELHVEYSARYIDGVMKLAIEKRKKDQNGGGQ